MRIRSLALLYFVCVSTSMALAQYENGQTTGQQQQGYPQQNFSSQNAAPTSNGQSTAPMQSNANTMDAAQIAAAEAEYARQLATQRPFPKQTPEEELFISQVLDYWTKSSSEVERYQCDFRCYEYDPTKVIDPRQHFSYESGIIRHMPPDKGLIRVEKKFTLNRDPQTQEEDYVDTEGRFCDWWLCDGKQIYDFNRVEKQVTLYPIPEAMQGKEIINSPLPFFFGVSRESLEKRFWVELLQPPQDKDGNPRSDLIALDIYPRTMEDATNYNRVRVILDRSDFLPSTIVQFMPQWSETAPHRRHYEFLNREKNPTQGLNIFRKDFLDVSIPSGWTVVKDPGSSQAPPPSNPRSAQQPAAIR